ncbi:MAG: hypothetical protein U1E65_05840 [Myxococcota bacterium]
MRNAVTTLSLSLLAASACTASPGTISNPPPLPAEVAKTTLPPLPEGHPDVSDLAVLSRGTRRLSVDQLERSLDAIGQLPPGTVKLPESLALTLGRPDYLQVTDETLDPSPLFMKFMMDLGGIFCGNVIDSDPQRPEDQRVLTRFSDKTQNLRYLVLRFTGIEGAAADSYVQRLGTVFDQARLGVKGDAAGWQGVCVALFTSPEFLLY